MATTASGKELGATALRFLSPNSFIIIGVANKLPIKAKAFLPETDPGVFDELFTDKKASDHRDCFAGQMMKRSVKQAGFHRALFFYFRI